MNLYKLCPKTQPHITRNRKYHMSFKGFTAIHFSVEHLNILNRSLNTQRGEVQVKYVLNSPPGSYL